MTRAIIVGYGFLPPKRGQSGPIRTPLEQHTLVKTAPTKKTDSMEKTQKEIDPTYFRATYTLSFFFSEKECFGSRPNFAMLSADRNLKNGRSRWG